MAHAMGLQIFHRSAASTLNDLPFAIHCRWPTRGIMLFIMKPPIDRRDLRMKRFALVSVLAFGFALAPFAAAAQTQESPALGTTRSQHQHRPATNGVLRMSSGKTGRRRGVRA